MAAADYDDFLERKRAERYDGGDEDQSRGDEDERDDEEEKEEEPEDEQGERADSVAALYHEGHERRALIEMALEDDERCLKSYMEVR